jgi:spermidine synthase
VGSTPVSATSAIPLRNLEGSGIRVLAFVLFFASGAAGLVYQVIWLRQLTLVFGATAYASSVVLSTFMGGLALGSWWAGRRADRWHRHPLQNYAVLELAITGYAAAIPWLLASVTPLLELAWRSGADRNFVVLALGKFLAIALLILPATTLMGATLPVLSRLATTSSRSIGGGVGALYAANTFGAVVGTIFAAFFALPAFGVRATLAATVALNALVGLIAWFAGRGRSGESAVVQDRPDTTADPDHARDLVVGFAISGAAAMVLEVAWTRGLALVLGSSVYAYASMLTAFLVGLASGTASAVRFLRRRRAIDPRLVLSAALGAAGLLSFGTAYALQTLPRLFAEVYFRFNPPPEGWWLVQLGLALIVMFPTTFALGWVFPLVLECAGGARAMVASSVGRVYAANTLGTIVGAALGGFVFIPVLGVGTTLVGVAALQLVLGAALARGVRSRARTACIAFCLVGAAGCLALRPNWDLLLMNSGVYMNVQNFDRHAGWTAFLKQVRADNTLVFARDGLTASILVANQPKADNLYLTVNGKTDASSRLDLETQIMAGQLPMLLHPAPHDVLVIGLASGISVGSVATHPVERVRVVEVESAMMEAAKSFGPHNGNVLDDPRVSVSINDARNELQFNPADYDVIVSEPSNPWMTVAANLFTDDFFRIARTRLRPGGVFGQWIQAYCLAPEQVRSIVAGFHRAFPHVLVFETLQGVDLLLIGSDQPLLLDTVAIDQRLRELRVALDLARIGIRSANDVVGLLQTGGTAVDELSAGSRRNTDDNGYVEFSAPKALYLDSQEENLEMLQGTVGDPLSVLSPLIRTPESPDRLRLELIRRWVLRDQAPRASRAAVFFSDPALETEARQILGSRR